MDGKSNREIDLMFAEKDHEAMEWVAKRKIKKETPKERRAAQESEKSQED